MNRLDRDAFFRLITDSLRILGTNHGLDFGLIPELCVNNKLVVDRKSIFRSKTLAIDLAGEYLADIYFMAA